MGFWFILLNNLLVAFSVIARLTGRGLQLVKVVREIKEGFEE